MTACRSGEVREARWKEFDFERGIWTIPAERMNLNREHRVPLTPYAVQLVKSMKGLDADLVFPSRKPGVPLSNMVFAALMKRMGYEGLTSHGFRSTFRDWCSEYARADWAVAELSLAHSVGDQTERAEVVLFVRTV